VNDWFRSLSVLGIAFVGVVALTFGLAALIVPGAAGSAQAPGVPTPDPSGRIPRPAAGEPVTTVGGILAVSGDREADFVLEREATDQGYALAGPEGRVFFGGNPLGIERISFDGLEFYLDEGDCELDPGERDDPTGVAGATIRCEDVEDVRDGGVLSFEGTVGVSADMLGLRGDLPPSGGTIEIGDVAYEFPFAVLTLGLPTGAFQPSGGFLFTDDGRVLMHFDYDVQAHALTLETVEIDGVQTQVDRGACSLSYEPIGRLNPRTNTSELTVECPAVRMAGETVRIGGTIVADLVDP
jgi:hypothetical protein